MKIDAHQHFWHYNTTEYEWMGEDDGILKRDYLPDDLLTELLNSGYSGCIAVQARQTLEETLWLLELAEQFEHIRGVVGWVDLQSKNIDKELDEVNDKKWLKGVRHVVQDEPDDNFMLRLDFLNGISKLAERNLVYEILIFERQLATAIELVKLFPNQLFVVDHIAKPNIKDGEIQKWKHGIGQIARFPNVSIKVSGIVTEAGSRNWKPEEFDPYLNIVWKAFGEDRIILGSDWPVCLVSANYEQVMSLSENFFKRLGLEALGKVAGSNASRIYRL